MAVASEGRNSLERRAKEGGWIKRASPCHTSLQIARAAAADTLLTRWSEWTPRVRGRGKGKALGPKERNTGEFNCCQFSTFCPGKFVMIIKNLSLGTKASAWNAPRAPY